MHRSISTYVLTPLQPFPLKLSVVSSQPFKPLLYAALHSATSCPRVNAISSNVVLLRVDRTGPTLQSRAKPERRSSTWRENSANKIGRRANESLCQTEIRLTADRSALCCSLFFLRSQLPSPVARPSFLLSCYTIDPVAYVEI